MSQHNAEEWVDNYGDALYGFAMSRVYESELAADLVQDTFLSALAAIDSFQGKSSIKTWLISILKRKIIDHYRKKSTSNEISAEQLTEKWEDDSSPFDHGLGKGAWKQDSKPQAWEPDELKQIEEKEFQRALSNCLARLPENWRASFVLKVMDESPTEEVCKELNISSSNLWVMLHRARHQLRKCLEKNWINQ